MTSGKLTLSLECTPVVDTHWEPENGETLAAVIAEAVAAAEGVDATELPPLYDVIDTDALNQLFSDEKGRVGTPAMFSFCIENWNVFVNADGRIRVCDATEPTEPAPLFENWSE